MTRVRPENRFEELIRCATDAFIVERSYKRTQMADIAERLGVSKGTVYLYVESKEALFYLLLQRADLSDAFEAPGELPLQTPAPGTVQQHIFERLSEGMKFPVMTEARNRDSGIVMARELELIIRELYEALACHRCALRLAECYAQDDAEFAKIWYASARVGFLEMLSAYFEDRSSRGHMAPLRDTAVSARLVIETCTTWAVHRHWDPSPQEMDDEVAKETVIETLVRGLLKEEG